jgi:hypothetical protein
MNLCCCSLCDLPSNSNFNIAWYGLLDSGHEDLTYQSSFKSQNRCGVHGWRDNGEEDDFDIGCICLRAESRVGKACMSYVNH